MSLYKVLLKKLKSDTAKPRFKYIDNKTERSVEASIKTLATKDDISNVKDDIANVRKEIGDAKADTLKWMFIFWVGQVGAMLAVLFLFLKK